MEALTQLSTEQPTLRIYFRSPCCASKLEKDPLHVRKQTKDERWYNAVSNTFRCFSHGFVHYGWVGSWNLGAAYVSLKAQLIPPTNEKVASELAEGHYVPRYVRTRSSFLNLNCNCYERPATGKIQYPALLSLEHKSRLLLISLFLFGQTDAI